MKQQRAETRRASSSEEAANRKPIMIRQLDDNFDAVNSKKPKNKYMDALVRQKGQVRKMKQPAGSFGGEATVINPGISRSVRFNW